MTEYKEMPFITGNMVIWIFSLTLRLKTNGILDKKHVLKTSNCCKKMKLRSLKFKRRKSIGRSIYPMVFANLGN